MVSQMLHLLLPGVEWRTEIPEIPQSEIVSTSRASALRYFELVRKMVTGARPILTATDDWSFAALPERELVEGIAFEVYLDRHEEAWVVAPEKFF